MPALLRRRDVEDQLPLAMGGPSGPTLCVGLLDGDWCLYHMAEDSAGWMAFAQARADAGEPLFPEHRMRFLIPGEVVLRCSSRGDFIKAYAELEITFDASYRAIIRSRGAPREPWPWSWLRRWRA